MIELIALLGNPGETYRRTRHNVAWLFAEHCGWETPGGWKAKWGARYADVTLSDCRLTAIKPQNFMNRSGESIAHFCRYHRVEPGDLIVVHDDVELAFGNVVVKTGGGLAGHNGLRSLSDRLGSRAFRRLRIGVGRPTRGSVSSYVLSSFSKSEETKLPEVFDDAIAMLERTVAEAV